MNKKELIDSIVQVLTTEFEPPYSQVSARDRAFLEQSMVVYLETKLSELRQPSAPGRRRREPVSPELQQIQAERIWDRFFFFHPDIAPHAANRKLLFDYALSLSDVGVVTLEHLNEAAATLASLDRQKPKTPLTATNLKHDEETLQKFCRENQLESNTAALNLLRQEFGAGFNSVQVGNALQAGLISLGRASDEQIAQWAQEDAEERQNYLINVASHAELKQVAKHETEQRRIEAQRQQVEQQIQAREQMDAQQGYPALPTETSDGTKIDARFLKQLSGSEFRKYMHRFGAANVTARLNGVR